MLAEYGEKQEFVPSHPGVDEPCEKFTVVTGGVTVIVNELLPVFPAASVAVHVTVDIPSGKKPKPHSLPVQPPTCNV